MRRGKVPLVEKLLIALACHARDAFGWTGDVQWLRRTKSVTQRDGWRATGVYWRDDAECAEIRVATE